MLFNSVEFLIFLPIVVLGYFLLRQKYRWFWIFVASAFFYMYYKPIYIVLLLFVIVNNYLSGILIGKFAIRRYKRITLVSSLILNLSVLMWFKYFNFLNENLTALLGLVNVANPIPYATIFLPLGISFFTFQGMSYTIDVYREEHDPEKHFGVFATYLMFFPQLVAGPIERARNLLDQFYIKHTAQYHNFVKGLRLILLGMIKKVVVADRLGIYVTEVYSNSDKYEGFPVFFAVVLFTFQLYCDFSGYTDIALGSARILGFKLMQNFDRPFIAKTISEFWRRWHISLSTWINDYLYNPILINQRAWGQWGIVYALMVSFSLIGLWHGASWNFVFFGLMHGVILSYEVLTKKRRRRWSKRFDNIYYNGLSVFLTFSFFTFSIIFFRSSSLDQSLSIIKKMIVLTSESWYQFITIDERILYNALVGVPLVILLMTIEYFDSSKRLMAHFNNYKLIRYVAYVCAMVIIAFFGVFLNENNFIYFQF